ncbi:MAG: porin, partial [Prevotella sp.]
VNCLAGFTDRSGCHSSNGRDIGLQLQGDVMLGKTIIHYQVGMFNGQGINMKDEDNMKDIIGGIWVSPLKGLRIGAFGWTGSYARNGSWTNEQGNTETGRRSLKQERYAFGAEYKNNGWQMRSEYIHSTGWGFSTTHQDTEDMKKADIDTDKGNKADGLYALVMAPMVKNRLWLKARYDMYRKTAQWSSARTQYEIGVNCILWKNIEIQTEYAFVNDRNINPSNYSMVDCELCVRF